MVIFFFPLQANLYLSPAELDSLGLTSEAGCLSRWISNLSEDPGHSFLKRPCLCLWVGFLLGI